MIRKAHARDIDRVAEIYEAIHASEERGELTVGWARGVYPVRETARAAVERGDLFVSERAGSVEAAAILNQVQVPEYAQCTWKYPALPEQVMVLHTLVVDPHCGGRGYGTAFVAFYEEYARAHPRLRVPAHGYAGDQPGRAAAVRRFGLSGAGHRALCVQRYS